MNGLKKIRWDSLIRRIIWSVAFMLLIIHSAGAQSIFEGQVMDKTTQLAIPSVTVSLLREKLTTSTNSQGYYKLDSELTVENDTLIFSSVGYISYRLPTSDYLPNVFILLQPSSTSLDQVDITRRKLETTRINGFDLGQIKRDLESAPTPFSSQFAYAKLFTAAKSNALLTKIELGRIAFESKTITKISPSQVMPLIKSNPKTRFIIHVLSASPLSKSPDVILFSKLISLDDNFIWVTIDLSKEGIVLNEKDFFIAVEWLRIPYNEVVKLEWAPRVRKVKKDGEEILEDVSKYKMFYQPALASYESKETTPSFTKTNNGVWVRSLGSKEIALSASIKY